MTSSEFHVIKCSVFFNFFKYFDVPGFSEQTKCFLKIAKNEHAEYKVRQKSL